MIFQIQWFQPTYVGQSCIPKSQSGTEVILESQVEVGSRYTCLLQIYCIGRADGYGRWPVWRSKRLGSLAAAHSTCSAEICSVVKNKSTRQNFPNFSIINFVWPGIRIYQISRKSAQRSKLSPVLEFLKKRKIHSHEMTVTHPANTGKTFLCQKMTIQKHNYEKS